MRARETNSTLVGDGISLIGWVFENGLIYSMPKISFSKDMLTQPHNKICSVKK